MGQSIVSMRGRNRRFRFWGFSVAIGVLLLGVLALPCRASEGVGQDSAQTPSVKEILGDRAPSPSIMCRAFHSKCALRGAILPFHYLKSGLRAEVPWMATFWISGGWAAGGVDEEGRDRWLAFRLVGFADETVAVQAVYLPCSPQEVALAQCGDWDCTPDQLPRLATLIQTTEIHSRDLPELHDLARELIELRTAVFPEPVIIVNGGSIEGLFDSSSGTSHFYIRDIGTEWDEWVDRAWKLIVPRISPSPVCPTVELGGFHDADDEDDCEEDWDEDWTDEAMAPVAGQPKAPKPPGR